MLPAETEERVKRRALNVCKEHLRKVLGVIRKIPQLFDYFATGDDVGAKRVFEEIRQGEEEVITARRFVSKELAEIGAILMSREDFLRFTNLTSEIADFSEGVAFQIVAIMEHNWKVPREIKEDLLKLSSAVLDTVLRLRETLMVLSYGSTKTNEKAKSVEIAERVVDDLYRELQIKLLSSKIDLPVLLLLRDILQLLENLADKAEDAADTARVLSFIM